MTLNKEELFPYIYSYLSYLFREKNTSSQIDQIFLFGSVARNDFDEESDIDLFIDTEKKNEPEIEKKVILTLKKFNQIEGNKWKFKGIKNTLSIKVGLLSEWELKESIEKEGIMLYSTSSTQNNLKKQLLFTFSPIISPKKRVKVIRTLFGRQEKMYKDKGIVQKYEGKILSPRVFLISPDALNIVTTLFSKEKIDYFFEEIWK